MLAAVSTSIISVWIVGSFGLKFSSSISRNGTVAVEATADFHSASLSS